MGYLLIGSYRAKLDKSGRLKVPERFRDAIEERYGKELFVTSLEESFIKIFPLTVWTQITGTAERDNLFLDPRMEVYLRRANENGLQAELDAKGRLLISPELRTMASLNTEVKVIGMNNHLEVWDLKRLEEKNQKRPLTYEDFKGIAELLSGRKPQ